MCILYIETSVHTNTHKQTSRVRDSLRCREWTSKRIKEALIRRNRFARCAMIYEAQTLHGTTKCRLKTCCKITLFLLFNATVHSKYRSYVIFLWLSERHMQQQSKTERKKNKQEKKEKLGKGIMCGWVNTVHDLFELTSRCSARATSNRFLIWADIDLCYTRRGCVGSIRFLALFCKYINRESKSSVAFSCSYGAVCEPNAKHTHSFSISLNFYSFSISFPIKITFYINALRHTSTCDDADTEALGCLWNVFLVSLTFENSKWAKEGKKIAKKTSPNWHEA